MVRGVMNKKQLAKQHAKDPVLSNLVTREGFEVAKQTTKSMSCFVKFLKQYNSQHLDPDEKLAETIETLTYELLTTNTIGCFADYVCKNVKCVSTAKNYFASAIRRLRALFPDRYRQDPDGPLSPSLYTLLAKKICDAYVLLSHDNRTPLVQHHIPITKGDHNMLCGYLYNQQRDEERAIQVFDFQAAGRASELESLRWDDLSSFATRHIDRPFVNCCKVIWFRGKTADLTGM
jgi:hypothetical protein